MGYDLVSGSVIPAVTGGVFLYIQSLVVDIDLAASPASILRSFIIEEAIGSMTLPSDGSDWPLFISSMPDGNDVKVNCGAIYDTSGVLDGKLSDGEVVQHPGIQIRIRSDDYETGYAKIEIIALALDDVDWNTIVINSTTYLFQNISRTTPIISLGPERGFKRRFLFTVNFMVTLKKVV